MHNNDVIAIPSASSQSTDFLQAHEECTPVEECHSVTAILGQFL